VETGVTLKPAAMADQRVTVRPGDVVAGRYRIDALVGQGGFGIVYRATQLNIGRTVALKMLLSEALAQADGLARFHREAQLAQRLEHPNTVRLYDFGETDAGLPFIAWEFLRGRPLDAVLLEEGGLSPARVARIAAQTLKALMEAHAMRIVHRDIKPSNIFLCEFSGESDYVKVLDFGIAKNTTSRASLTRPGSIVGTPNYMAPEQVSGGELSPASDLYSLGLVMAEALTGQGVFQNESGLAVCMAQISDAPVPLSEGVRSSPLGQVIARATQKSPAARYASAGEMLGQVELVAVSLGTMVPQSSPSQSGGSSSSAFVLGGGSLRAAPPPEVAAAAASASLSRGDNPRGALGDAPTARSPDGAVGFEPTAVASMPVLDGNPASAATAVAAPPSGAPVTVPATEVGALVLAATLPTVIGPARVPVTSGDAPATRRNLVIAGIAIGGVVTLVAVLGGLAIAGRLGGAPERPGPRAHEPIKAKGMVGPLVKGHFARLTNAQVRARIEDAGHTVTAERPHDTGVVWAVHPSGGAPGAVHLHRFHDAQSARIHEESLKGGEAVKSRDGVAVLFVDLGSNGASRALFDLIVR
jgi:serine/threonine-protein kinase